MIVLPHADLTLGKLKASDKVEWRCRIKAQLFDPLTGRIVEEADHTGNLLMTAGATDLWNGASTAGLSTPWNTTNTYLGAGDSSTAASAGQTDLQAAAGATMNAGDFTAATNASPIVLTTSSWTTTPVVGQVIRIAGIVGNTNANGDFEVSAVTTTTVTLLNSTGNAAFSTSAGSTAKPLNRYRQQANASGSAVVSTNQIVYVATYGTINGNFTWNEFATFSVTGTNKQAGSTNTPTGPAKMLNRAVSAGLITKSVSVSATLTETLSLS